MSHIVISYSVRSPGQHGEEKCRFTTSENSVESINQMFKHACLAAATFRDLGYHDVVIVRVQIREVVMKKV